MGVLMAVDPGTTTGIALTNVTDMGVQFAVMNKGLNSIRSVNKGLKGRRGGGLGVDFGEIVVSTEMLPGSYVAWFQIGPARGSDHEYWCATLICDLIEMCGVKIVAFEDFILRRSGNGFGASGGRDGLSPVRINANIGALMRERGITPFLGVRDGKDIGWTPKQHMRVGQVTGTRVVWQSPSNAKGVFTDERIRREGLWVPGRPHAVDAVRHLCLLWRSCDVKEGKLHLKGMVRRAGNQPVSDVELDEYTHK